MRRIADSSPLKVVRVEAAKERLDEEQQTVKAGIPQIEVLTVFDRRHLGGAAHSLAGLHPGNRKPKPATGGRDEGTGEKEQRRSRVGDRDSTR